ncbi:MAG TPA: hypothetical protein VI728_14200, partial [Syntrophales bacterium]|nr:hypothetical protein [Syntrophales bacterium]
MKKLLLAVLLLFIFLGEAFAFDDIKFSTGMTQRLFKEFSEQLGVALSYKPVSPAEPYGITGFDIGVEVSAVNVDDKYWKHAIKRGDVPGYVFIPKLHVIKGLPFGIDVGAVFSQVPDTNIKYFGGEVKYALMKGSAVTPAVAVRGTYTQLIGVSQLDFKTYGAEVTISKGVGFGVKLTPYAGLGVNWFESTPKGFASAPVLSGGLGLSDANSSHMKA